MVVEIYTNINSWHKIIKIEDTKRRIKFISERLKTVSLPNMSASYCDLVGTYYENSKGDDDLKANPVI